MKAAPKLTFLGLFAFALFTACKPSDSQEPKVGKNETNVSTAGDYSYSQKDAFISKIQAELNQLKQDMNALGDKIANGTEAVKEEAQPKFAALRDKVKNMDDQLAKVKNASASTWNDVKAGFEQASTDVKNSVTQARQWLSEKIAPSPTNTAR